MRIIGGYQNTRPNGEDFAITPYLFGVYYAVFGLGICWGWYSMYMGIGFGIPKEYPTFKDLTLKDHEGFNTGSKR